ncbi:MAG: PolC-type DNA polymerase III [Candidatus Izimaplasma sp.]|nr:PolC-type DNA polymerase III [Candidatus Izimaplasma bacterium]
MEKLSKLLDEINLEDKILEDYGQIEYIEVDEVTKTWFFSFVFEKVIPIFHFRNFIQKLDNLKTLYDSVDIIDFKAKFNEIDGEILDYYDYAIDILAENDKRITPLKHYPKDFEDEQIKIYVPKGAITPTTYRKIIEDQLHKLGFDFPVQVFVDEKQSSIEEEIQKHSDEFIEQNKEVLNQEKVEYIYLNSSNNITDFININELPRTEIELEEYKERNGGKAIFNVQGIVVFSDIDESNNKSNAKLIITNHVDSIFITKRNIKASEIEFFKAIKPGMGLIVKSFGLFDQYIGEVILHPINVAHSNIILSKDLREDTAEEKRVELHTHTKMSALDGVSDVTEYLERAEKWGHKAIGISDSGSVQAFPLLEKALSNTNVKPLYGVELVYVDDEVVSITRGENEGLLTDSTFVIFDIETTGLSVNHDDLIEIGAVKVKKGAILGEFGELINPDSKITKFTTNLTGITQSMVNDKRKIKPVLEDFNEFSKGCILIAHNAEFDLGFLDYNYKKYGITNKINPSIDTLNLAKALLPERTRFGLDSLARYFKVKLDNHHRAVSDAKATFEIFLHLLKQLKRNGFNKFNDLNLLIKKDEVFKFPYPKQINLLVKEQSGLRNLYKILSEGLTTYYDRGAKITKSYLDQHRDGILISSGGYDSYFFDIALNKTRRELVKAAKYYDYLEIPPVSHFRYLEDERPNWQHIIQKVIKSIVDVGKELNIPVVATGDVHHLDPSDLLYREILINTPLVGGGGYHSLYSRKSKPNQYYKTTEEMLKEFEFLGKDTAYEVVVTNSNAIADMVDTIQIIPDGLSAPTDEFLAEQGVPSISKKVEKMVRSKVIELYGDPLPEMVKNRVERELGNIIEHKFSTVYYISHLLVKKSLEDGYLVGSRGSVGSSFVATLMDITEVNPLPPHYVCPKCHFTAFKKTEEQKEKYGENDFEKQNRSLLDDTDCGWDLPKNNCPVCNSELNRDGHDIPFETFLGFSGDKVPDIDLNFSGDYQGIVHEYIRKLFGKNHAFRGGTISTCASRTSFAMVRDYYEKLNAKRKRQGKEKLIIRRAEMERLALGIEGSKRTSGQHPGGIVVVPNNKSIFDFTPIQYPGDSKDRSWKTTHYEYHSIENNLFKLDVLGHDDPTMIRYLMDLIKAYKEDVPFSNPKDIPVDDNDVYRLLSGTEVINLKKEDIYSDVASYGVPELGTSFVRGMLSESKPKSFAELVKISGLSHGTDVWYGNSHSLVVGKERRYGKIDFKDIIGCRDDIMVDLISYGMKPTLAFEIMEFVRKGKAAREPEKWANYADLMKDANVPDWYIWSCSKIKYMFPKAHATAYVLMAMRIAWFKLYKPIFFYAAYFSKRATAFDVDAMHQNEVGIIDKINDIKGKGNDASNKEKELLTTLEVALEMVKRGFSFKPIDLYKSDAREFVISEDRKSLILPFIVIDSMGEKAAQSVVEARKKRKFISKEDVKKRTKLSKVLFEKLDQLNTFDGMINENQVSIFDI